MFIIYDIKKNKVIYYIIIEYYHEYIFTIMYSIFAKTDKSCYGAERVIDNASVKLINPCIFSR